MSTEPPSSADPARRPGWLVEDRPDLVVVRSRGLSGGAQLATALLGIAALGIGAQFLARIEISAWVCVTALFVWLMSVPLLQAVVREVIRATPEGLELERRGLFGTRRVVLTGRPAEVWLPSDLLEAFLDPHLAVVRAGREHRFGRSLNREARAWLLTRLRRLWGLNPPEIDPPPRETR